jgi:hypothetical protein
LKNEQLGHYTYQALMEVDVVKKYKVFMKEIEELFMYVGTFFVDK